MRVTVYHTHIEVSPYRLGDAPGLEKMLSIWDPVYRHRVPVAFFIEEDTLYLPRGISTTVLEKAFGVEAEISTVCDDYDRIDEGEPLKPPKSQLQENGIKFLCGYDEFSYTKRFSQLGLNLNTSAGKTYGCVCAILQLKIKAIIITHQTKIKNQWIDTFKTMTSIDHDRLINLKGSESMEKAAVGEIEGDIYFINHASLQSYINTHGWYALKRFFQGIRVGIKIYDETHMYFGSMIRIDSFTNTYKTFYLTATFGRGNPQERPIYAHAFKSLVRYGDNSDDLPDTRKHILFYTCFFRSYPRYGIAPSCRSGYGFSTYKYIDYEMTEDRKTLLHILFRIIDETSHLEGKTLITSPKKESVEYFAEEVEKYTGQEVGTIYSNNSDEVNDKNKEKRYISSTNKSIGTGADIKGIRIFICLEPIGNSILMSQVEGRLREYSDDKDTLFFYPIDLSLKKPIDFYRRTHHAIAKKSKKIIERRM